MRTYIPFVKALGITPEAYEMIMWKNAAALFKLDVGEPAVRDPKPVGAAADRAAALEAGRAIRRSRRKPAGKNGPPWIGN
jgi:hypothetical protein